MSEDYEKIEYIQNTITELLVIAGFNPKVEYEQSLVKGLVFNVSVNTPKLLIGKQGANLEAFQTLVFSMVNKHFRNYNDPVIFTIDVDNYRSNREYQIKQQIKEMVGKLKYSKTPVMLPPMSRFERRFAHNYISEQFPHLTTSSQGVEPNRRIVISI